MTGSLHCDLDSSGRETNSVKSPQGLHVYLLIGMLFTLTKNNISFVLNDYF